MIAREVTARILADDRFKRGVTGEILAQFEAAPASRIQHPDFMRAKALVSLRSTEEMMTRRDLAKFDRALEAAENNVRSTLALNPADSFLWLLLYSVATARGGFNEGNIRVLEQSYALGPLEGWIAPRRNRLSLASFPALQGRVQESVVSEFSALVDGDFIEDAVTNLIGAGWAERERLLASLVRVDVISREAFAKRLIRDGIHVNVPGVEIDQRLWR
ncbi:MULTISPECIES: hypothetical protein [Bradyrhizobium]|uniref:hypothetical protein n=1 Tax=Bradyrhizobium TaxID=374 RepID=UPI00195C1A49|nr:hypothetical protein [Bradyrhizobium canariense]MBM7488389.1 hypothetical protein [Bradyrhizobium canariense]UFW71066.1 hypothetical protein BcanWU425_30870 [Bradyrhizobium canariense]